MPSTGERRRTYLRGYQRQWVAQRRRQFFAGKSCVRCGSHRSLELDHVDPSTKIHHRVWSWSLERRDAELAKCQVLCRPCHQLKTITERFGERRHGTRAMYKRGECRCGLCVGAERNYKTALVQRRFREEVLAHRERLLIRRQDAMRGRLNA